jgi:hypothetical protein
LVVVEGRVGNLDGSCAGHPDEPIGVNHGCGQLSHPGLAAEDSRSVGDLAHGTLLALWVVGGKGLFVSRLEDCKRLFAVAGAGWEDEIASSLTFRDALGSQSHVDAGLALSQLG